MQNEDRNLRIDILERGAHNAVCAVKLLLIHALRIGAVAATTWPELKAQTLARPDRTIVWATPDFPVIPRINFQWRGHLDVDSPAAPRQLLDSISQMSLRANIVTRLVTKDLRNGAASDLAHLNQNELRGIPTMATVSAIGHKMTTFMKDVTARYVGGSDVSFWNLRASSGWVDSKAPKIAQIPYVPRPFAKGEIENYCLSRQWDPTDPVKVHSARNMLRKIQQDEWRAMCRQDAAPIPPPAGEHERRGMTPYSPLLEKYFCRMLIIHQFCNHLTQTAQTKSSQPTPTVKWTLDCCLIRS